MFLCFRDCAACTQAVDLRRVKPQLLEKLVVVFANFRGALCSYFRDIVNLNGAADRQLEVFSGTLKRNDNVVLQ
jgi:hypothetical protein